MAVSCNIDIKARIDCVEALLLAGQTRLHLDRVEGLGDYLDLSASSSRGIAFAK